MRLGQMVYENIDPNGQYTIRVNGRGEMSLYVNKKKVEPVTETKDPQPSTEKQPAARSRFVPQFTVFPIPQELLNDRRLVVDWGEPNEPRTAASWFRPSVTEVWLLKGP